MSLLLCFSPGLHALLAWLVTDLLLVTDGPMSSWNGWRRYAEAAIVCHVIWQLPQSRLAGSIVCFSEAAYHCSLNIPQEKHMRHQKLKGSLELTSMVYLNLQSVDLVRSMALRLGVPVSHGPNGYGNPTLMGTQRL